MADFTDNNLQRIREVVRQEVHEEVREQLIGIDTRLTTVESETRRTGVLMENLQDQFTAVTELISSNLKVKNRVDNHGKRISVLETDSNLIKDTLKVHSRQLKPLT